MLAYIFWHQPRPDVEIEAYQNRLRTFHQTLAANRPDGLFFSRVFSVAGVPWLADPGPAFEDQYFLNNSAALDDLNHAAVSGACEEPHNRVARDAAVGTAGLYQLHSGIEDSASVRFATWFSKPAGVSYQVLRARLEPIASVAGTGVWQRQMTLGPTTEFTVYSPLEIQLPEGFSWTTLKLEPIYVE